MHPAAMAKLGLIELTMQQGSYTKEGDIELPDAWEDADQGPILEGNQKLAVRLCQADDL
jgi:hypothetical protein